MTTRERIQVAVVLLIGVSAMLAMALADWSPWLLLLGQVATIVPLTLAAPVYFGWRQPTEPTAGPSW